MTWQELGGISEVFYTHDRKFCFQRVGNYWRLYDGEDGHFILEYRSFVAVQEHIMKARGNLPYEDPFVFEEDPDAENDGCTVGNVQTYTATDRI